MSQIRRMVVTGAELQKLYDPFTDTETVKESFTITAYATILSQWQVKTLGVLGNCR